MMEMQGKVRALTLLQKEDLLIVSREAVTVYLSATEEDGLCHTQKDIRTDKILKREVISDPSTTAAVVEVRINTLSFSRR